MKVAGIDVGSTTTKTVIMEGDRILSASLIESGTAFNKAARSGLDTALELGKLQFKDLNKISSTGHGRKNVDFANEEKAEIMATAKGAVWLKPGTRLVIDIGGQGIRAILLEPNGNVEKFVTNDKCSAGTGCFLDTLAFALEVGLEDLGDLSAKAKTVCNMSTTCTIFAESEMVSLVARGTPKEDIIAGLHESVAKKVAIMVKGFKINENLLLCGGVARNSGVVAALRSKFPDLYVPKRPQLVTALGAALMMGGG
jgi:predicted CoA-substrate-specific enzyme activase